ncbi:MAG: alpha/beta hydrolase [Saprospiraceae bacterium]|nr:alpha/beta hydrolase [Saprospiraceae bacterium]
MLYHKEYFLSEKADWVVFVHGAGGSSAVWFKQLKDFKIHFNLLLIDLRGHGKSVETSPEKQQGVYSFEAIANDIIEVLDFLKVEKAHFVGVSLGTLIIRQLGDMISHRMQSMILVGAITHFNFKSRFWVTMGRIFKNVLPYMWLYRLFAFVIMPAKQHAESRNIFIREAQKLCQREFLRWYKLTSQMKGLFQKYDVHLPIPTLYVMGDRDYMFLDPITKMLENVKTAALLVVDECGHVVNIEQAKIFNEEVIKYLQRIISQYHNRSILH